MSKPPPGGAPVPLAPVAALLALGLPVALTAYLVVIDSLTLDGRAVCTIVLIELALLAPIFGYAFGRSPLWWTTRVWFWAWHPDRIILGILTAVAVVLAILSLVAARDTSLLSFYYQRPIWAATWTAVGATAGVWIFLTARWKLRRIARDRLLPDETLTARVVRAIKRAEAVDATRVVGVDLDLDRARPTLTEHTTLAPHRVGDSYAYAVINRDRLAHRDDHRVLNDWTDPSDRWLIVPKNAGAMRALVIAASGSGKTYLLFGLMLCAAAARWPSLFIDLKGDPDDADRLVDNARKRPPHSDAVLLSGGFRFFDAPSVGSLRDRILALFPPATGADRYYQERRQQILGYVLDDNLPESVSSLDDIERMFETPDLLPDPERAKRALRNPTRSGGTDGQEVLNEVVNAIRSIRRHIVLNNSSGGWSYATIEKSQQLCALRLFPATDPVDKAFAELLLVSLRQHMQQRMATRNKDTPLVCIIDEFPQMIAAADDAATTVAMLHETARSANIGLVLAGQTVAGFSNDPNTQVRMLTTGAALIVGRTNDPEPVVKLAGTTMHLESSADPEGGLKSSRAQHTYRIHPDTVREVETGGFWIIADGTTRRFNTLP
ncbi:hypothetical protein FOV72_19600 [Gordonia rubripertincta]|uniref:hypothetical protein n=1 Tax=Gordonia rubripertincta TaxID=36822 RepID=UPI00117C8C4C|nr:hypothetical protein [Gordonia rubripertincta]TSD93467.1 hypothetical protein FOV72_19600 [Gordonia rubripertincta]